MTKRSNKKGFTIIELVIVIAVIAILAAVLIPTFSGVIKKANQSADQQAVNQMNTALAMYEAENGKPKSLIEVKKALDEALVNVESGLVPVTQGYAFYWDSVNNKIELAGNVADVKEGWLLLSNNGLGTKAEVTDVAGIKNAIASSTNANPAIITLKQDITVSEIIEVIGEDKAVVLDLNGKTLKIDNSIYNCTMSVEKGAKLEIKNGTLDLGYNTDKTFAATMGILNQASSLSLSNVEVKATAATSVFVFGFSDTSIVGCTISGGEWGIGTNSEESLADGARIVIEDSNISAKYVPLFCSINANFVAKNSTFTNLGGSSNGTGAVVNFKDGEHELINCKLVAPDGVAHVSLSDGEASSYSGSIKATFNGCGNLKIKYDGLNANATISIDSEYTIVPPSTKGTGTLTINGTAISD